MTRYLIALTCIVLLLMVACGRRDQSASDTGPTDRTDLDDGSVNSGNVDTGGLEDIDSREVSEESGEEPFASRLLWTGLVLVGYIALILILVWPVEWIIRFCSKWLGIGLFVIGIGKYISRKEVLQISKQILEREEKGIEK